MWSEGWLKLGIVFEEDSSPGLGSGYWYDMEAGIPSGPDEENAVGGSPRFHMPDFE